ncbi:cuticle protein 16.5-like [Trichoplusia ni]|uniref:Cuticle protein 16.5-like n=1 Tax=Trichoplusia ni TaxID=7111 RepID=A0A7E5VSJ6_TRINI|nr:cuticle protein 16.5-like [Trichoplusia ni]
MNSLVVFLSVVALVAGKPSGLLHGGAVAYSAPAVLATAGIAPAIVSPTVYSAPAIAAIAPAAVSSQSRIDIKSTPAITSTVVSAPIAYGAYSAPVYASGVAPAYLKTEFAAPALASYAAIPAATAIAAPTVPLDTPEVAAARAAHFEAKAFAEHSIHKRSAPFNHLASPLITSYAAAQVVPALHAAPLAYSAPIAYSTPLITKTYGGLAW